MTVTQSEVVEAARAWVGTPCIHQASLIGVGCDCLGLVRGVFRQLYGQEPASVPPYTPDWSEASGDERLWEAARRYLAEAETIRAQPGKVLLMRMRGGAVAKHLGIVGSDHSGLTLIQAYSRRGVIESPLTQPWTRLIVAAFSFPGSDD